MRITAASVALAVGVMAQPNIMPRNSTGITNLLSSVYEAMANANNHALQYVGGEPTELRKAGLNLIKVIGSGIETANNLEPLTPEDVVAINPLSEQLTFIGAKFLENLGGDAPKLAAGGFCEHALEFATNLGEVSNKFFTATKEKFPADYQDIAQQEISAVDARFAKAEAALSPPACVDQVKAPGSETSASSSTSIAWQTGTSSPGEPTSAPGGDRNQPNGTHPAKPTSTPVTGSSGVLALSSAALGLAMGVALLL
ncbi:hypothetical protein ANO14919_000350 [Xylariales sp. No.14919]|nr:hypothetical protein ANO14919_000350 [Xylariales sp. No.14919]